MNASGLSPCTSDEVPCVRKVEMFQSSRKLKVSWEIAARECRHAFLALSALARGAACVALAHRTMINSRPFGGVGCVAVDRRVARMTHTSYRPRILDVCCGALFFFVKRDLQGLCSNTSTGMARMSAIVMCAIGAIVSGMNLPLIGKRLATGPRGPLRSELIQTKHALIAKLANKWEADGMKLRFSSQHRGLQRELIRQALIGLGRVRRMTKLNDWSMQRKIRTS